MAEMYYVRAPRIYTGSISRSVVLFYILDFVLDVARALMALRMFRQVGPAPNFLILYESIYIRLTF